MKRGVGRGEQEDRKGRRKERMEYKEGGKGETEGIEHMFIDFHYLQISLTV